MLTIPHPTIASAAKSVFFTLLPTIHTAMLISC
jgi:hypothetical protein